MLLFNSTNAARLASSVAFGFALLTVTPASALNGTRPLGLTPTAGWQSIELMTQGDDLTGLADPGYGSSISYSRYDGLGIYRNGSDLTVWMNHESTPASISRIELDHVALQQQIDDTIAGGPGAFTPVIGVGFAYDKIFDGSYHSQNAPLPSAIGVAQVAAYGADNFARFCSGTSHGVEAFGIGRGFVDSIYLTGEEVLDGKFYALDETTRTLWEAPDLGLGAWENAAAVDTGETDHVALVLNSDVGDDPGDYLQLYVGRKGDDANGDGQIDFLERNGLRGGEVYYFRPSEGASTTDLPDGPVAGSWSSSTSGALLETKLEDIHTNPLNGSQLVFADQDDGVYRLDAPLAFTAAGAFDPSQSPVSILQIDDDEVRPLGAPDNLTWSRDGYVYVQEDGDGDQIFRMNPDGSGLTAIAAARSEPSGIIDASVELGYLPGSVLLTSLQGSSGRGAQLGLLVAPDAAAISPGDYDFDGDVDTDDYLAWRAAFGAVGFSPADGTGDRRVDAADYAVWRDAIAVPEPAGLAGLGMAITALVPITKWRR